MHILVVGLNYRTAPVQVRERFTFTEEALPIALNQLKNTKSILECVIVATCNRTEIYAVVDRLQVCGHYIRSFMEDWFGLPREEFTQHLYMHEDQEAIQHLFRVTSGLDSMVLGETQILGQVRDGFSLAQQLKSTGMIFNTLFKQSITTAKRAHSETAIGENAVSVSYAAVELGKRIFGKFTNKTVLIIGAGKMSELTVKHLHANGANRVIVANRTLQKAAELADKFKGDACSLDEIASIIRDVDIVISSTGSAESVLSKAQVEVVMSKRKSRPLFLIDIAVPRDIDPAIHDVDNVFLYDIDDLHGIVDSNLEMRRKEAEKIEDMIKHEMDEFDVWYKTLDVIPAIRALQEKAANIHNETLESMFNKLTDLDERERKVIRKLTKSIVNQMLHDPILRIKELAAERRGDQAIDYFTEIFALEEQLAKQHQQELSKVNDAKEKETEALDERTKTVAVQARKLLAHS
jgi:glutamyl-tRNA reductase